MEDGPKVNGLAKVSRGFGITAMLVFSINLLLRHTFVVTLTFLAIAPIALVALITGVAAIVQIRRSEGSQRGRKIALLGIALGIIAPLLDVVWLFVMLGSCETSMC